MELKHCNKCNQTKSISEFHKDRSNKDGLTHHCAQCRLPQSKEWRDKNRTRIKEINDKSRAKRKAYYDDPERKLKNRSKELKKRLGVTHEEYEQMLSKQGGVCAICKRHRVASNKGYMAVDHCHVSGKIRGVLCNWCNRALGLFEDKIELFRNSIEYLENNKTES